MRVSAREGGREVEREKKQKRTEPSGGGEER